MSEDRVKWLISVNAGRRHKWVLEQLAKIPKGETILDAGAGTQPYKPQCSHLLYTSQDFNQYDGKGDGKGLQNGIFDIISDIVSDIVEIPVADESFDNVLCTEVFEHVPDPVRALKELTRIVKPGGRIIITAPFCSLTHFAPYHFCDGFNRYFWKKWLSDFGFQITDLVANGNFFDYLAQEVDRIDHMIKQYCPGHKKCDPSAVDSILATLKSASSKTTDAGEMLTFAYFIVAEKKNGND